MSGRPTSRAASQHLLEAVGRVGVVDDDGERLARVDGSNRPGTGPALPRPAAIVSDRDAELGRRSGRGQGVR